MKRFATALRPLCAALLLTAAAAAPAYAAQPASTPAARPAADNPAQHPNFTVRVVGKGQPVLLIPGLTCPGAVWDETVARYQKQYQCHVISLAGFGGAAPASTEHLLQNVRDQLLGYIKAQKLQRPAVIGHSLGGFLALWMSSTQPEALGPLVIVDSLPFLSAVQNPAATAETARPMAEAQRQQMSKGGAMPVAMQRQMIASMITDTARQTVAMRWGRLSDGATVGQAMYDLSTTDLRQDIARIQQPVLVLGAWAAYKAYGSTKESTRAIFEQQYARLPQHRVEMSEAGRHFLMWDDTQWFFAQADAFLQQHALARK